MDVNCSISVTTFQNLSGLAAFLWEGSVICQPSHCRTDALLCAVTAGHCESDINWEAHMPFCGALAVELQTADEDFCRSFSHNLTLFHLAEIG